jgi:hypothetical protein
MLKTLKTLEFVIVDTLQSPMLKMFLESTIGLKFVQKTEQQLSGVSLPVLKKACKALGFKHNSKTA